MAINRRQFLQASTLLGTSSILPITAQATSAGYIIGASRLSADQYAISKTDLNGKLQWQTELPARGHAISVNETTGMGVAIARRPGQYLLFFDVITGHVLQRIELDDSLKLNGHAVWFRNQLIVSAADRASSKAALIRFTHSSVTNTFSHHNTVNFDHIGPHELVLRGETLWLAIGGLHTAGRDVLNKENFRSGLLQLNAANLDAAHYYPSPFQGVSLRHLDVDDDGLVIAGQYQLDTQNSVPLLYKLESDGLIAFDAPKTLWAQLRGYIGSVKLMNQKVYASSPRAHWLGEFNLMSTQLSNQRLASDVCALAKTPGGLLAGTGTGKLLFGRESLNSRVIWDNHFSYSRA